ncbi:MAG: hypothetical protein ACP5I4_06345, partial [Oceanipulchritudo sp.]
PAIEVLQTSALPLGYRAAEGSKEKSAIFVKGQREFSDNGADGVIFGIYLGRMDGKDEPPCQRPYSR